MLKMRTTLLKITIAVALLIFVSFLTIFCLSKYSTVGEYRRFNKEGDVQNILKLNVDNKLTYWVSRSETHQNDNYVFFGTWQFKIGTDVTGEKKNVKIIDVRYKNTLTNDESQLLFDYVNGDLILRSDSNVVFSKI